MIQSWRIVHEDYLMSAFDGEGARITGGRWNSEGVPLVYTAGTLSLALLEMIVHLGTKETLKYFKAIPVTFSADLIQTVPMESLPLLWKALPSNFTTKAIGDRWVRDGCSAVLCVPSAVVPYELNYLLNPQHPNFSTLSIGRPMDLPLDPRVVAKLKS